MDPLKDVEVKAAELGETLNKWARENKKISPEQTLRVTIQIETIPQVQVNFVRPSKGKRNNCVGTTLSRDHWEILEKAKSQFILHREILTWIIDELRKVDNKPIPANLLDEKLSGKTKPWHLESMANKQLKNSKTYLRLCCENTRFYFKVMEKP